MPGTIKLFDPSDSSITYIPSADAIHGVSALPEGVSADEISLALSASSSERIVRLAAPNAGTAVAVPGTPSPHGSVWMVFDGGGDDFALVRLRADEDNELGAGALQVLHRSGGAWSQPTPVTESTDYLDFSPAWAVGGDKLAFLRATADTWRNGTVMSSLELHAGLMLYDMGTSTATAVLSDNVVRRNLIVPGGGTVAAVLEEDGGLMHVNLVDLDTAETAWAIGSQSTTEHTAVGAPGH